MIELDDIKRRMEGAIAAFQHELSGLRTGRASASLLDPVTVEAYGSVVPLQQVATVSVPEARMLSISVWDKALVGAVERAIRMSDLGLNPITDGNNLRVPLPELNEERRKKLVKVAHNYAEQAKVVVRHIRRDSLDFIKKEEKNKKIGEDDCRIFSEKIQKLTDDHIINIDKLLLVKESEIMQV